MPLQQTAHQTVQAELPVIVEQYRTSVDVQQRLLDTASSIAQLQRGLQDVVSRRHPLLRLYSTHFEPRNRSLRHCWISFVHAQSILHLDGPPQIGSVPSNSCILVSPYYNVLKSSSTRERQRSMPCWSYVRTRRALTRKSMPKCKRDKTRSLALRKPNYKMVSKEL